ncbi:MAG: GDSL-type esterase/lipase family protein [Gemmiger sp.]|nr:GDSL-type esterase/lipase family protein [Gemmiger sp.]
MSSKNTAGKQNFWSRMDTKSKMFFVLALCAGMLLATTVVALLILGVFAPAGQGEPGASSETAQSESLVVESGYNKDENSIDTAQYTTTILEESPDAGQAYLDETLFVGDSNTARMYRGGLSGSYASYANAIGSVGMTASSLKTFACIQFSGYSGYKTMPEAVALMQPKRVIITFGTNDLSPSRTAATFVESYQEGIQAIVAAYPSVDIIVNSIPPLGQEHSNANLTQNQVDAYNKAIVQMCQTNGWKYLNSAEALKDSTTGYAKSGMVITTDGIHLTDAGMAALFTYVRTHSYITEDDRPAMQAIPTHTADKDAVVYTVPVVATPAPSVDTAPSSEVIVESESTPQEEAPSSEIVYTYWSETISATCTDQGYILHHCNEDSSRDYADNYVPALGHDPVTQADGSIVCSRDGALLQAAPAPAPTETPAQPTAPPATEPTQAPEPPSSVPEEVPSSSTTTEDNTTVASEGTASEGTASGGDTTVG